MGYKHDYDKALTRLTHIISRLYQRETLSVKELAEEFNVSERTISRDFNDRLCHLFPVEKIGRKWRMQDGMRIEKNISFEEQLILDTIEKISESIGKNFSSKAKNLISKLKQNIENPIYARINMEDISDKVEIVRLLEEAITNRYEIKFLYQFDNYEKELDGQPLKLVNYEGYWYLVSNDQRGSWIKKYYLKNIKSVKITGDKFKKNDEINRALENATSIWFQYGKEPFEVILHIDNTSSKYLKRKPISPTQRIIKEYPDESMDISVNITHEMEIIPIVGYWIPHFRIVEPKWLVEKMNKLAKKFLEET